MIKGKKTMNNQIYQQIQKSNLKLQVINERTEKKRKLSLFFNIVGLPDLS